MIHDIKKTIRIENVVASLAVGQKIDIEKFASEIEGAEYNRKRFPAVVYRTSSPKVAALLFGSGKIVCTGAKSIEDVSKGLEQVFDKMRSIGIKIDNEPDIKIRNIVATANLGTTLVDLNAVAMGLGLENVEYEPEIFPGLVYRLSDPKVVSLIFGSGKIVITGGNTLDKVIRGAEKIVSELKSMNLL